MSKDTIANEKNFKLLNFQNSENGDEFQNMLIIIYELCWQSCILNILSCAWVALTGKCTE